MFFLKKGFVLVIVKIKGGLGNQLFQYAFAKALSLKFGKKLLLDLSWFQPLRYKKTVRKFYLNDLFTKENFSCYEWTILDPLKKFVLLSSSNFYPIKIKYINELFIKKNGVYSGNDNIYLDGYWQSHLFGISSLDYIKYELVSNKLFNINSSIFKNILESNSVSLHIRRGDYTNNSNYVLCGNKYYQKAVDHIFDHVTDPIFFIFTDDPNWVRDNFNILNSCHIIDNNATFSDTTLIDFYLMMYCKHHIIANSTYSWWSAMLSDYNNKIVIAPNSWFAGSKHTFPMFPASWLLY